MSALDPRKSILSLVDVCAFSNIVRHGPHIPLTVGVLLL